MAAPVPTHRVALRGLLVALALSIVAASCGSSTTASDVSASDAVAPSLQAAVDAAFADDTDAIGDTEDSGEPVAEEESSPDPAAEAADDGSANGAAAEAPESPQSEPPSVDEAGDENLAFGDTTLPSAPIGLEDLAPVTPERRPVSLEIEDIDVVDAGVIPVGVNADETFEVPPADQVGWYRFGPIPGDQGSAVLAAHIAFDGVDGVFRRLAEAEVGAVVVVGYDDGTSQRYRIESVIDYVKEELPDELFAREGDPQLALITCGGAFNPQLRSYESNTVAVAVPI